MRTPSINRKSWLRLLDISLVAVGTVVTILGYRSGPRGNWGPYLIAAAGLAITGAGVFALAFGLEFQSLLDDRTASILDRLDWSWNLNPKTTWKSAATVVSAAQKSGSHLIETNSIRNIDIYENAIRALAAAWRRDTDSAECRLTRVFCFSETDDWSDDGRGETCKQLFEMIMDPSRKDKQGIYDDVRVCIQDKKIRILHLPYPMMSDLLVLRTDGPRYDCLWSFAPPSDDTFVASARIGAVSVGGRLWEHANHIVSLAIGHARRAADLPPGQSICSSYRFDEAKQTLLPRNTA